MKEQTKLFQTASLVGIILVVFLAVLTIKEIKSISYVGKDIPLTNNISVTGKADVVSIPDVATFSFSITETGKTVADAQAKATEKTNNALKAVRAGGVQDKDIKTLSYSINPHYEYTQGTCTTYVCPPGKSILTGYDVSQTIEVKVRDLAKAGDLFDSIGSVGVQNVNGLTFAIDNIDTIKAQAREKAITNARQKAEKIAKDLGVSLVRITSFYDSSDDVIYPYGREGMGGDVMTIKASVAPEIPKGEQKVTASVSITYEIR